MGPIISFPTSNETSASPHNTASLAHVMANSLHLNQIEVSRKILAPQFQNLFTLIVFSFGNFAIWGT